MRLHRRLRAAAAVVAAAAACAGREGGLVAGHDGPHDEGNVNAGLRVTQFSWFRNATCSPQGFFFTDPVLQLCNTCSSIPFPDPVLGPGVRSVYNDCDGEVAAGVYYAFNGSCDWQDDFDSYQVGTGECVTNPFDMSGLPVPPLTGLVNVASTVPLESVVEVQTYPNAGACGPVVPTTPTLHFREGCVGSLGGACNFGKLFGGNPICVSVNQPHVRRGAAVNCAAWMPRSAFLVRVRCMSGVLASANPGA